jgi:hypothetical protein
MRADRLAPADFQRRCQGVEPPVGLRATPSGSRPPWDAPRCARDAVPGPPHPRRRTMRRPAGLLPRARSLPHLGRLAHPGAKLWRDRRDSLIITYKLDLEEGRGGVHQLARNDGVDQADAPPGLAQGALRLLPEGIGVIPVTVGLAESTRDEFLGTLDTIERRVAELAGLGGIALIAPSAHPVHGARIRGRGRDRRRLGGALRPAGRDHGYAA